MAVREGYACHSQRANMVGIGRSKGLGVMQACRVERPLFAPHQSCAAWELPIFGGRQTAVNHPVSLGALSPSHSALFRPRLAPASSLDRPTTNICPDQILVGILAFSSSTLDKGNTCSACGHKSLRPF